MRGTSISLIHLYWARALSALWAASGTHSTCPLALLFVLLHHHHQFLMHYCCVVCSQWSVFSCCDRDKGGGWSLVGGMYVGNGRSASGLRPRPSAVPGDLLDGAAAVSQWLSRPGGFGPRVAEPVRSRERPPQQCSAALPAGQAFIWCQTHLFMYARYWCYTVTYLIPEDLLLLSK